MGDPLVGVASPSSTWSTMDRTGRIVVAYPFSGEPTVHSVRLPNTPATGGGSESRRPRWCSSHGPHAVGPPPSVSAPQSPSTSTATTCPSTPTPSRHGPRPPGRNRDNPPVLQLTPDRVERQLAAASAPRTGQVPPPRRLPHVIADGLRFEQRRHSQRRRRRAEKSSCNAKIGSTRSTAPSIKSVGQSI